ncbi:hypothetical protein V1509DRAFT_634512 [Lipomyces kononenkoae]
MGMYLRTSRAQGAVQKVRTYARLQNQSSWSIQSQESGNSSSSRVRGGNSASRVEYGATGESPAEFMRSFVTAQKTVVDRNENRDLQRQAKARESEKLFSLEKFQQAKKEENRVLIQDTRRQKLSEQLQMAALQGNKKNLNREQDDAVQQARDKARPSPLAELFNGLEKAAEARERQRQRAAELKALRAQSKFHPHLQPEAQSSFDQVDIKKIVESIPVSKGVSKKADKKPAAPEHSREERNATADHASKNQQTEAGDQPRIVSNIPDTELPKSGFVDLVDEHRQFHSRLSLQDVQERLPLGHKLITVQFEGSRGQGSLMVVRIIKKRGRNMAGADAAHSVTTKVSV